MAASWLLTLRACRSGCACACVHVLSASAWEQVIACASLFLGGKVEETPKALRDVLKAMCNVRFADSPRQLERVLVCVPSPCCFCAQNVPLVVSTNLLCSLGGAPHCVMEVFVMAVRRTLHLDVGRMCMSRGHALRLQTHHPDAAVPVQAVQDELREVVLVAGRALLCALGFDLTRSGACPGDAGRAARGGAGGGARAAVRGGV